MYRCVALIPARSGSKRILNKNIKKLNNKPLISYTIKAAIKSKLFDQIILVTDNKKYASIGKRYGAKVPFIRSKNISGSKSPDIQWVKWILKKINYTNCKTDIFFILRPTSPFRTAKTIKKAWNIFFNNRMKIDSLRAVQLCKEHPGKMWMVKKNYIVPIIKSKIKGTPWHSNQYSALPKIYIQNASLEISWVKNPLKNNLIAGNKIFPFYTNDYEGFDINVIEDWEKAEKLAKKLKI